jgi:hypothetical protein
MENMFIQDCYACFASLFLTQKFRVLENNNSNNLTIEVLTPSEWFLHLMRKHHVVVGKIHGLTFTLFFMLADVCNVPYVTGPCLGYFRKWYYNPSLGGCQEFVYGGCGGNGNRFSSLEECERICLHREELLPPGNDTALSHQGTEFCTGSNVNKLCALLGL